MSKKFTRLALLLPLLAILALQATAQNTALSFDGTAVPNQQVTFGTDVIPYFQPFSVELWAYVPSALNADGLEHDLILQGSTSAAFSIGYMGSAGGQDIVIGDVIGATGITMPFDQWVHIAVTGNADPSFQNATIYVNGAPKLSFPSSAITFLPVNGVPTFSFGIAEDGSTANAQIEQVRVFDVERTAAQIKYDLFRFVPNNEPGLLAAYYMNEGTGIVLGSVGSLNTATPGSADGTLVNGVSWTPSPIQYTQNAVNLNGTPSQVTMEPNSAYDLTSGGTIEAWIYPTTIDGTNRTIIGNRGTNTNPLAGANYSFHLSDQGSGPLLGIWNNNAFVTTAATIPLNTWTHVAFVYNGTNSIQPYINGVPTVGTLGDAGSPEPFGGITGQPLTIGITAPGNTEPFLGSIDEVRIWNTQRTQTEIFNNKDITLSGNEAGLVGLWSFDEGIANGTNTGLQVVPDMTPTNGNGDMTGFALSGTSSNFVTHAMVPLPVTLTKFTVVKQGTGALLQWQTATEQNSKDFTIQRSTDGIKYTGIGSVEAAGNSTSLKNYAFVDPAPVTGKNYYRLNQSDLDGKSSFSPVRVLAFSSTGKLVWYSTGSRSVEVSLQSGSNEKYTISDISGHLVRQGQLSSGKTSLSGFAGGIYFVKVTTFAGESMNTKVIIP